MRRLAPLLVLALLAAGCASSADELPEIIYPPMSEGDAVRFIVWGDTGTGDDAQRKVARSALRVCEARGCDFVLQTGDNVYDSGVESPDDPQFDEKFEEPYADFDIPFYLVLGNHDAGKEAGGGEVGEKKGDHQIAYSKRDDRASDKWNMPARWYDVEKPGVLIAALDTNDAMRAPTLRGYEQASWLERTLDESDATWKFAFAHHPLYSNGRHGDAGGGDGTSTALLRDFLMRGVCGKVDVYFSGHDHDLQWLKAKKECGRTEFIVSGAGANTRPLRDDHNAAWFAKGDTLGFFWIEIQEDEMRATVYDGDGRELFSRSLKKE